MYEPTYNRETKNSQETPPYPHKTLNYSLFQNGDTQYDNLGNDPRWPMMTHEYPWWLMNTHDNSWVNSRYTIDYQWITISPCVSEVGVHSRQLD